jgi:hypothetical protein
MTSNFPNSLDNDATIPFISSNITQLGGQAINSLRDAVFAIEGNIGIGAAGSVGSVALRLNKSLDSVGNILPSAIASMGLITLPIVNSMVSATAAVQESKLALNYGTTYLNNFITNVNNSTQTALDFISNHGYKLEPHLAGSGYNHYMNAVLVALSSTGYFNNASGAVRNNTNLYTLFQDINNDLVSHEVANGTPVSIVDGIEMGGTLPPINYGHVGAGIFLNSSTFAFIPQTITDVQSLADFLDSSNSLIIGTRIQTLYSNGIPVNARAGALPNQTLGQLIIPPTAAQAYILYGGATTPFDDIDHGDDLIEFFPSAASVSSNSFDASFNLVKAGDVITVAYDGYGNFSVQHIIREIKYSVSGGNKRYVVRIDGKNILDVPVIASINSPLFDNNKYGVLALAGFNNLLPSSLPSLISGCPRGAEVLSVGFNPDSINSTHYFLYLAVYPDGNPLDQVVNVPPIDISGDGGTSPGSYTLNNIVRFINNAFRSPGFNNRFMAFQYNGELGIKMTDAINNISFSILDGVVNSSGLYDLGLSNTTYPNNAIGVPGYDVVDATGFGPEGAAVSSPAFSSSYASPQAALFPTKIWCPLTRKTAYVNGVEIEKFAFEPFQVVDGYGDGYWFSTLINKTIIPGSRVQATYQVNANLSYSGLEVGKTITAIAQFGGTFVDSGRFVISNIQFNDCTGCGVLNPVMSTDITVYDAIQSPSGTTPYASAAVGTEVFLYFSSDSVSFNAENVSDWSSISLSSFKRSMEVYINQDGYTFSQERGRLNFSGSNIPLNTPNGTVVIYGNANIEKFNVVSISPKLRGYAFGTIDKINLTLTSYNQTTGVYLGYLCKWDGSVESNPGPLTLGKRGNVVRFYDATYVEYIDISLDIGDNPSPIASTKRADIQLFPTLQLDEEVMLIGTTQINGSTNATAWIRDDREFGNVSVEQLTTSALEYIAAPTQLINENGVVRGFSVISASTGSGTITVNGGVAVVNGTIIQLGTESIDVPAVVEVLYPGFTTQISTITWYLCVNDEGELVLVASTDYDPNGSTASIYQGAGLNWARMFYVSNTMVGGSYPIRGTFFSDLVFNQRDLCPIAVITATTSGSPPSITAISAVDARRFVGNGYSGFGTPFVLGYDANFQSFTALNSWLTQLVNWSAGVVGGGNAVGTKVIVKGSNPILSSVSLNYNGLVKFIGDGGIFNVDTATGFILGSNVSFDNITFNYNYDPVVSGDPGYLTTNLVNHQNGLFYCLVGTNSGISITNCIFNWNPDNASVVVNRYPFVSFEFDTVGNILEGVNISGNTFNSTLANQIDVRAAVAFICTIQTTLASNVGLQLLNCTINNNVAQQDQMVIISSLLDGGGNIIAGITTLNTTISGNMLGTIGFMTRYSFVNDFPFAGLSPGGKNIDLTIQNNTCKLIDALDGYGNEILEVANIDTTYRTGASVISGNTVSWIRAVNSTPDTFAVHTTVSVLNNNLSAHNTAFRVNFNSVYPTNSNNNAISVISQQNSTFGEAIISGNLISQNTYTNLGGSTTIYTYNDGILSWHFSTISNNRIVGFSSVGIQLINPGSTVTGNSIHRQASSITAFIHGGSNTVSNPQHMITGNFLDSTTIDGSNINTIIFIGPVSSASNNTNQVGYSTVSLTDYRTYIAPSPSSPDSSTTNVSAGSTAYPSSNIFYDGTTQVQVWRMPSTIAADKPLFPTSGYLIVGENATGSLTERNFSITVPLDTQLPSNVKVLSATLGVYLTNNGASTVLDISADANHAKNRISLTLVPYQVYTTSSVLANSIVDVKNATSLGYPSGIIPSLIDNDFAALLGNYTKTIYVGGSSSGNVYTEAQLLGATQYVTVSIPLGSQSGLTTTGQNYRLAASVDLNWKMSNAAYGVAWNLSPILLTYQW